MKNDLSTIGLSPNVSVIKGEGLRARNQVVTCSIPVLVGLGVMLITLRFV